MSKRRDELRIAQWIAGKHSRQYGISKIIDSVPSFGRLNHNAAKPKLSQGRACLPFNVVGWHKGKQEIITWYPKARVTYRKGVFQIGPGGVSTSHKNSKIVDGHLKSKRGK